MAPVGKTFLDGEVLYAADTNAYLDSARWAPQISATSGGGSSIPKTDTFTSTGSAFSVTLPTGWTSMTLHASCTIRFELVGGRVNIFGARLLIAGVALADTDTYANLPAAPVTFAQCLTLSRAPSTVYTSATSLQLQGFVSSASTAAITVSTVVYNVIRFRET